MYRKRIIILLSIIITVAAAALWPSAETPATTTYAAGQSCGLTVEIIAAPFAVVDSNKPGIEGPKIGMMGARIRNTSGSPVSNLYAHIGNGSTPGSFPSASGGSLSMLSGATPSYFLNDLGAGESITAYWPVRYPFTYDVVYPYTIWLTNATGCTASDSATLTTQSEISALANKLLPTGSQMLMYPQTASPGGTITVEVRGFELGTIGQGPKELSPYDAWLQPLGNLDFDPSCVRLVKTEAKLNSLSGSAFVDQLYFEQIRAYNGNSSDYIRYTFLALRACATTIQPYQEAASGTQEKYNGDYETTTSRIQIVSGGQSNLNLALSADTNTVTIGDPITFTNTYDATSGTAGYPDNGSPIVITSEIPDGTSYTAGSTTSSHTADVQYSTNDGSSWSNVEPGNPATVTTIRWVLADAVNTSSHTTTYDVTAGTASTITATSTGSLLDAFTLTTTSVTVNSTGAPDPTPTPPPDNGGVGSGSEGGLESEPLDVEPSSFLEDPDKPVLAPETGPKLHKANPQAPMSLNLADFLPATGPDGTTATAVIPVDVLAVTDAPDARAVDFIDSNGQVRAVALGIHTLNGPYEHDYGVCNRFKEYSFDQVDPVGMQGLNSAQPNQTTWFWNAKAQNGSLHEDALIFHIFVDEVNRKLHIDSRWIKDSYPETFDFRFDYVFNMQVWSNDLKTSEELLGSIVDKMESLDGGSWDVNFRNTVEPVTPELFIKQTNYSADIVRLTIKNRTADWQPTRIHGTWRSYADRNTLIPIDIELELPPGEVELALPFPGLLDTTLFMEHNGFTDKIYNGGGLWFSFTNTPDATAAFTLGQCRGLDGIREQDLLLAGCITFTGSNLTTADAIGLGRTLNPNGRPVDVSPYDTLRFWARGDGTPVRVLLETADISDGDFYQLSFTPGTEWQQFTLPIEQFNQRGFGTQKPLALSEMRSVIWLNAATSSNFRLELDQVSFTTSSAITLIEKPQDSANTNARSIRVAAATAQQATLFYSTDLGSYYTAVAMTATNGQFSAEIPGQSLGSDIVYYIETMTADGYLQRLPLDAPNATFRYRVDDRPSLLVDDFNAGYGINRRLLPTGTFRAPEAGGSVNATVQNGDLTLTYNVAASGQQAGYFSLLGNANVSEATTLNILARASRNGAQLLVSLKDGAGFEPRISAGDILPGGLTTKWQWIQVPLSAFPTQLDRTRLDSVTLSFANGHGPAQGTVHIREIRFTNLSTPQIIDTFDDGNLQRNGRGQSYWSTAENGTLQATAVSGDALLPTGSALKLDYNVQPGGYALWSSPLGRLTAKSTDELRLWVRGINATFSPHLYLTDGSQRARVVLTNYVDPAETGWQLVRIPLNAFTNVDATKLEELQIAYEFGSGSGALWLDQISIGKPGAPQVGQRSVQFTGLGSAVVAVHTPHMQPLSAEADVAWLSVSSPAWAPGSLVIQTVPGQLATGSYLGRVTVKTPIGSEIIQVKLTVDPNVATYTTFMPLLAH